jgi:hypothetical protein
LPQPDSSGDKNTKRVTTGCNSFFNRYMDNQIQELDYCLFLAIFRLRGDRQSGGAPAQTRAFRHNPAKFLDINNMSGRMQIRHKTPPRIMNLALYPVGK